MHTSNFGLYHLLSIPSVCQTLFHECASILSEVIILMHNQHAKVHITQKRHTLEGCSRLSVKCTPSTLVSVNSPPSPLSAKLCSISVQWSVQKLAFYRIISRLKSISHSTGTLKRDVVCCPSNAHPQLWSLSTALHHLCLLNFVPWVCIHPFRILLHNQQAKVHITQ